MNSSEAVKVFFFFFTDNPSACALPRITFHFSSLGILFDFLNSGVYFQSSSDSKAMNIGRQAEF